MVARIKEARGEAGAAGKSCPLYGWICTMLIDGDCFIAN